MAVLRTREVDGSAPTTHSFDIDTGDDVLFDGPGPFWVSVQYWIDTPGGVGAGAFTADFNYVDPTGVSRPISGSPISLQDPNGIYIGPITPVVRQSNSSAWTFDATLIGIADGALISYRVMVMPGDIGETGSVPF